MPIDKSSHALDFVTLGGPSEDLRDPAIDLVRFRWRRCGPCAIAVYETAEPVFGEG